MGDLDSSPRSYARFSKSVYLNSRSYSSKYLTPAHVVGGKYFRRGVGLGDAFDMDGSNPSLML